MKIDRYLCLCLTLACASTSATTNRSVTSANSVFRELTPYTHEISLGDYTGFSLDGVSVASANLTLTQTSVPNCGSAEFGDQGCTQSFYASEPAVEVRISLRSSGASSDEPSVGLWRSYFHLSEFTKDEIKAIQETSKVFDPFGNATVRSRELARSLFVLSVSNSTLRWSEPIFGNLCSSSLSGGEHSEIQCNITGQRTRSRVVNILKVSHQY